MELLVALVISSFLVTVIYQLMQGNSRYVRAQSSREEVQQNGRAAIDLISGDLRAAIPSGIQAMGPDSIRFYLPRAGGMLCNTLTPSSTTAWVVFPVGLVTASDVFGKSDWGIGVEQTSDATTHTDVWRFVASPTQQTTGNPCAAIQPSFDATQQLELGFNAPSGSSFVTAGSVPAGSQVMVYQEMRYDVAASSSSAVPGMWIRRMVGRNGSGPNMQTMAGPVPAAGALNLSYYKADGTVTAIPSEVRRIAIRVISQSRNQTGTGTSRRPEQMDTVSTEVYLRNVYN